MTGAGESGVPPGGPVDLGLLVSKAIGGDHEAWNAIVDRFGDRVWRVCRSYGLSQADAADVFQQTWLRALEKLDTVRDPERLGAWIGTTCRHEALAARRRTARLQLVGDSGLLDRMTDPDDDPERPILTADRDAELWEAFAQLSERCRRILRVLVTDVDLEHPSYEHAAEVLGVPIGSLGPTRGRCLARLRGLLTEGIGGPRGAS